MSRSYKKPYVSFTSHSRGSMKEWKNHCNRSIRRMSLDIELSNGQHFKKINDRCMAPDDSKSYWDDPKAKRK